MSKILVVGDAILDRYVYGEITRQSPEDSRIPVVDVLREEYRLGGCLNVAANIKSIWPMTDVSVLAPISFFTHRLLRERDIDTSPIKYKGSVRPHEKELIKTRVIDVKTGRQLIRLDNSKGYDKDTTFYKYKSFDHFDAVVVSDYCKGFVDHQLRESLSKYHGQVYVDTKNPDLGLWRHVTNCIVKINDKEYEKTSGKEYLAHLIVTRGSDGCIYRDNSDETSPSTQMLKFGTVPVSDPDVIGCGDVFLAGLVTSYLRDPDMWKAIKFANYCAGENAKQHGTAIISM